MRTTVIRMSQAPMGWQTNPQYVYIGRAGRGSDGYFGNPFPMQQESRRKEVLEAYDTYFRLTLQTNPEFVERVKALKGKTLVCFCAPLDCHGHIIAKYLETI